LLYDKNFLSVILGIWIMSFIVAKLFLKNLKQAQEAKQ
jgi:hypothetical protein